jgi:hypothetical protein
MILDKDYIVYQCPTCEVVGLVDTSYDSEEDDRIPYIKKLLDYAGWKGEGTIQLFPISPYCEGKSYTMYMFYVKENKDTSWIVVPSKAHNTIKALEKYNNIIRRT